MARTEILIDRLLVLSLEILHYSSDRTDDVENRRILQVVVCPHAGTGGGICLTRTGHTTLQRGNLLHADVGHEP